MKFRIILAILFVLPILMKGQSDVIFYSEAPMYVKYKEGEAEANKGKSSSTTLYIEGSAKFSTGASIEQKGRTEITKDFINAKDPSKELVGQPGAHLFVNKTNATTGTVASEKEGVVAFIGKALNGVSSRQRIYGVLPTSAVGKTIDDQKMNNWIDFPTISVEKGLPAISEDWRDVGYLMVDVTGAVSVDYINAEYGERFAVDAGYDAVGTNSRVINSGYAKIKKVTPSTDKATYSQVNLNLYKYNGPTDDDRAFVMKGETPVADPSTYNGTLRDKDGWNYLTGFTSPFVKLGADYMFFHALAEPNAKSITSNKGPVVNPFHRMNAGQGYFMSMEVSHNDHALINERWDFGNGGTNSIVADNRARGGYVFNRMVFHDYLSKPDGVMDNFSRFYYNRAKHVADYGATRPIDGLGVQKWIEYDDIHKQDMDRSRFEEMLDETFNTADKEFVITLKEGLNFLGNPFMVPISLNPLLGYSVDGKTNRFPDSKGMDDPVPVGDLTPSSVTSPVYVSSLNPVGGDEEADLRARYWLINEASIKYEENQDVFQFKAK